MTRNDTRQNETQGGGRCLRGCLIATVVFVVLLVVGGLAVYVGGRAYLARNLPQWQERYPAIGIATSLLQLRQDLAMPEGQETVQVGRHAGAEDRSLLPEDIPVFDQPLQEAFSISPAHVTGYQRLAEPHDAVLEQVRASMGDHGWELAAEEEAQEGVLMVWIKGERDCQIEVSTYDGASELWLRCSGTE